MQSVRRKHPLRQRQVCAPNVHTKASESRKLDVFPQMLSNLGRPLIEEDKTKQ